MTPSISSTTMRQKQPQDVHTRRSSPRKSRSFSNATTSTRRSNTMAKPSLLQSFREVLRDLDNAESRDTSDHVGVQISDILNQNPHFRKPLHLGLEPEDYEELLLHDEENYPTLRPLLCVRNAKWLQRQYRHFYRALLSRKDLLYNLPRALYRLWTYVVWNVKPIHYGIMAFFGWGLFNMMLLSIGTTFVTLWTVQFGWLMSMTLIALLVDWKEMIQMIPGPIRQGLDWLMTRARWLDDHLLLGNRYRGREWNAQHFEWDDSSRARSFGQSLWKFPPPSSALDNRQPRVIHKDWSPNSAQHIDSIDFCYSMLREAHIRKQYAKQQRSKVRKKKAESMGRSGDVDWEDHDLSDSQQKFSRSISEPSRIEQDYQIPLESPTSVPTDASSKGLTAKVVDVDLSTLSKMRDSDLDSISSNESSKHGGRSLDTIKESTADLNWMDVGAEIGMKILGSAPVQKALTSHDTAERIITIREKVEDKLKNRPTNNSRRSDLGRKLGPKELSLPPVHSMWTSPSAAANCLGLSPCNTADLMERTSHAADVVDRLLIGDIDSREKPFVLSPRSDTRDDDSITRSNGHEVQLSDPRGSSVITSSPLEVCDPTVSSVLESRIAEGMERTSQPITPPLSNPPNRRPVLMPGVKIVVPLFPHQPGAKPSKIFHKLQFQMATVVSCTRISVFKKNHLPPPGMRGTNCLSITVQLDKSFLRDGKFAQMTLRIMDEWSDRYMPKHSKFALGSCVATTFGLGVLVGWRVEDDCHVVRSLWQRRGPGSACAYLQRDAILSPVEAAVGFDIETTLGPGEVIGYKGAGRDQRSGRYLVAMTGIGKHQNQILELNKRDVVSCKSARFIPVIEHLKEAVEYQLQVDNYNDAIREDDEVDPFEPLKGRQWRVVSKYSDILWKSFLRATEEDKGFDDGMNEFLTSVVNFFDGLDAPPGSLDSRGNDVANIIITTTESSHSSRSKPGKPEPGFWVMNDVFGLFTGKGQEKQDYENDESIEVSVNDRDVELMSQKNYDRVFGVIRTLMRTVSIARAGCVDEPEFKLALSLCYEFLIFIKTIIKVQQKNMSPQSLKIWRRAWEEIISTFGPVKERLEKIGQGIAERMEKQGRRAKVRLLRFVDTVVQDEILLMAMEHGEWNKCGERLEQALVTSKIIDEESREHYHRTAQFIYNHFASIAAKNGNAAARNNEKLAHVGMALQFIAAPRKSMLRFLIQDWMLDTLERLLVRVFDKEEVASRMLSIHATNFHTLRQFRMLKNFTIAGKFWMPLLDAADAEFSFMVSKMPSSAQEYMVPISSLFSLCVCQFHRINGGDLTKDWLDFLLDDEAVNIIHEIDMKLILALEAFSRDVKEMMVVLPYYPRIEDDILNLVDEVDIDEFLKEASEAVEDPEKLSQFVREKSTIAIERFLDYLPKMSIPVEKRDLADGWVLTCRGADGGDLTLTDLTIKRENLTCQVMGGDTLFFPMIGTEEEDSKSVISESVSMIDEPTEPLHSDASVLDHIRVMILNARRHGCWQEGVGGVQNPPTDRYIASALQGLPVSSVLNCGFDLWRNLEIDDDELLEIAIRDVSYQIQLQHEREMAGEEKECKEDQANTVYHNHTSFSKVSAVPEPFTHRFNPRVDPSVLFLEIQKLTFNLDKFLFRIEKHESRRTVFDPVFEGSGSLMVKNVSIKLRVECVKEYVVQMGRRRAVPLLQIRELDVQLEKVKLKVKDTGADWLLNKVVQSFEDSITQILATNLNEQVRQQMDLALENLNGYFSVNPDIILGLLDVTMDDLEEKVTWV